MENSHLEEKYVETRDGRIFYYQDRSFPNRPTVLLLHGLSSNHTTWNHISRVLRRNQYNSVMLDLRGHGLSDKTKNKNLYSISSFSQDLQKIVDQEKIKDFILVGYSFGGQVAIDYTVQYPQKVTGLILISVNHASPLAYKHLGFLTPMVIGGLNLLALVFLWQQRRNYHYYQHGKAVGYWDSVWDGLRTMPLAVNFWMLANVIGVNFKKIVCKIKIPTTIVYGKNDVFITKKEMKDLSGSIENSKIIISQNPSHFVGTNSQEEITDVVLSFLRDYEDCNFQ